MMIVPKNKKIFIGSRRFIEGEAIPPHLAIHINIDEPEKPKRGRPAAAHQVQKPFSLSGDEE